MFDFINNIQTAVTITAQRFSANLDYLLWNLKDLYNTVTSLGWYAGEHFIVILKNSFNIANIDWSIFKIIWFAVFFVVLFVILLGMFISWLYWNKKWKFVDSIKTSFTWLIQKLFKYAFSLLLITVLIFILWFIWKFLIANGDYGYWNNKLFLQNEHLFYNIYHIKADYITDTNKENINNEDVFSYILYPNDSDCSEENAKTVEKFYQNCLKEKLVNSSQIDTSKKIEIKNITDNDDKTYWIVFYKTNIDKVSGNVDIIDLSNLNLSLYKKFQNILKYGDGYLWIRLNVEDILYTQFDKNSVKVSNIQKNYRIQIKLKYNTSTKTFNIEDVILNDNTIKIKIPNLLKIYLINDKLYINWWWQLIKYVVKPKINYVYNQAILESLPLMFVYNYSLFFGDSDEEPNYDIETNLTYKYTPAWLLSLLYSEEIQWISAIDIKITDELKKYYNIYSLLAEATNLTKLNLYQDKLSYKKEFIHIDNAVDIAYAPEVLPISYWSSFLYKWWQYYLPFNFNLYIKDFWQKPIYEDKFFRSVNVLLINYLFDVLTKKTFKELNPKPELNKISDLYLNINLFIDDIWKSWLINLIKTIILGILILLWLLLTILNIFGNLFNLVKDNIKSNLSTNNDKNNSNKRKIKDLLNNIITNKVLWITIMFLSFFEFWYLYQLFITLFVFAVILGIVLVGRYNVDEITNDKKISDKLKAKANKLIMSDNPILKGLGQGLTVVSHWLDKINLVGSFTLADLWQVLLTGGFQMYAFLLISFVSYYMLIRVLLFLWHTLSWPFIYAEISVWIFIFIYMYLIAKLQKRISNVLSGMFIGYISGEGFLWKIFSSYVQQSKIEKMLTNSIDIEKMAVKSVEIAQKTELKDRIDKIQKNIIEKTLSKQERLLTVEEQLSKIDLKPVKEKLNLWTDYIKEKVKEKVKYVDAFINNSKKDIFKGKLEDYLTIQYENEYLKNIINKIIDIEKLNDEKINDLIQEIKEKLDKELKEINENKEEIINNVITKNSNKIFDRQLSYINSLDEALSKAGIDINDVDLINLKQLWHFLLDIWFLKNLNFNDIINQSKVLLNKWNFKENLSKLIETLSGQITLSDLENYLLENGYSKEEIQKIKNFVMDTILKIVNIRSRLYNFVFEPNKEINKTKDIYTNLTYGLVDRIIHKNFDDFNEDFKELLVEASKDINIIKELQKRNIDIKKVKSLKDLSYQQLLDFLFILSKYDIHLWKFSDLLDVLQLSINIENLDENQKQNLLEYIENYLDENEVNYIKQIFNLDLTKIKDLDPSYRQKIMNFYLKDFESYKNLFKNLNLPDDFINEFNKWFNKIYDATITMFKNPTKENILQRQQLLYIFINKLLDKYKIENKKEILDFVKKWSFKRIMEIKNIIAKEKNLKESLKKYDKTKLISYLNGILKVKNDDRIADFTKNVIEWLDSEVEDYSIIKNVYNIEDVEDERIENKKIQLQEKEEKVRNLKSTIETLETDIKNLNLQKEELKKELKEANEIEKLTIQEKLKEVQSELGKLKQQKELFKKEIEKLNKEMTEALLDYQKFYSETITDIYRKHLDEQLKNIIETAKQVKDKILNITKEKVLTESVTYFEQIKDETNIDISNIINELKNIENFNLHNVIKKVKVTLDQVDDKEIKNQLKEKLKDWLQKLLLNVDQKEVLNLIDLEKIDDYVLNKIIYNSAILDKKVIQKLNQIWKINDVIDIINTNKIKERIPENFKEKFLNLYKKRKKTDIIKFITNLKNDEVNEELIENIDIFARNSKEYDWLMTKGKEILKKKLEEFKKQIEKNIVILDETQGESKIEQMDKMKKKELKKIDKNKLEELNDI